MNNIKCCFKCLKFNAFDRIIDHGTFKKYYYGTILSGYDLNKKYVCSECVVFDVSSYKNVIIKCYGCDGHIHHFYTAKHKNIHLFNSDFQITGIFILNKIFCRLCSKKIPADVTEDTLHLYVSKSTLGIFANTTSIFD